MLAGSLGQLEGGPILFASREAGRVQCPRGDGSLPERRPVLASRPRGAALFFDNYILYRPGVNGSRGNLAMTTILLSIKRQTDSGDQPYWEDFEVPDRGDMNVISSLQEIQRNPVNKAGQSVRPVVWDCNCLEEICGACSMIVNGKVRQACTALVKDLEQPIVLEPMDTFPIVRDLMVDRQKMFENLKKVKAWIDIDGTHDLGPGPPMSAETALLRYTLSKCMTCGCCGQACPNVNARSSFIGPAVLSQVRLFNLHPSGEMNAGERLDLAMGPGGVSGCGNAQNCVEACPKEIPLTDSIAAIGGDATIHWLKKLIYS
jgi:succinate dehydrogenase / fumarate reductase iron-sulfur subunit